MKTYKHLLSPLTINGLTIRNRLMQTAHARHFAENGVESERDRAYVEERAKGGIGLITVGNLVVHPTGGAGRRGLAYTFLPEGQEKLRHSAEAAQRHGARVFVQLNHFGGSVTSDPDDYRVLWAPSRAVSSVTGEQSKEMEPEDIADVIGAFASGTEWVKGAGVDGVEIHAAHGYLLHSFLSPLTNRRTDSYGGPLENRLRLIRQVIAAARARVGRDYPLGVRLSLSDEMPGGLTVDDVAIIARLLANDGLIDFISTSSGLGPTFWVGAQTGFAPAGFLLDKVGILKVAVPDLPVFAVGGIDHPDMAEAILVEGKADMVAITRGQIADPEFARKVAEGRADEIRHCIRANQGCLSHVLRGMPVGCTVNPAAGREQVFGIGTLKPASSPSRWLVVGGGPAGMKAAEGLAQRGHKVTLIERCPTLGGQLQLITRLPGRQIWDNIRADLDQSLRRLGVDVRCGTLGDEDFLRNFDADRVILATGAIADRSGWSAISPPPPGVEQPHVLTLWDVIQDPGRAGKRVVLMDDEGAYRIGGAALLLLEQGTEVVLVSRLNTLLPGTQLTLDMPEMYKALMQRGLRYRLNSRVTKIDADTVTIADLFGGQAEIIEHVNSVVLGTARHPDEALYQSLKGSVQNLCRIGDCVTPRTMDHAIYEGFLAGRELLAWAERPFFEDARDPGRPIEAPRMA